MANDKAVYHMGLAMMGMTGQLCRGWPMKKGNRFISITVGSFVR